MSLRTVGDRLVPAERNNGDTIRRNTEIGKAQLNGLGTFLCDVAIEITAPMIIAMTFNDDFDAGVASQPLGLCL